MSVTGDPNAVEAAAGRLSTAATALEGVADSIHDVDLDEWEGEAADAFRSAQTETQTAADELAKAYRSGQATLARYAAELRAGRGRYEAAAATFETARRSVEADPLDVGAYVSAIGSRVEAIAAVGEIQAAAARAAAELQAAVSSETEGNEWWDPFGWFTGDESEPDQPVTESILDDDAFDADDVSQGSIGDCFMLSTIVSLLGTDEGDEFLRDHVKWDAERNGYVVTIYVNGEAKDVFVDNVYGQGARQDDWEWLILSGDKASIAALYEAAIAEEYGYGFLDGGVPADAMEIITGEEVLEVKNESYAGLSNDQLDPLRENLADGGQVVLSSPREGDHTITVQGPDGATREVDIVSTHSYAVTRIEDDGSVWVRNPWGPGNSADGGGEFRVSAEDVEALFWRATYTDVTD
ncbi:C2 family cysteine protease [Microbacterium sp. P04]|uniref:C2 family cysteine protease n=1 Tax=Microbacterium sp. P04 TaxID=3366947 RepID=UPI0037475186